MMDTEREPVIGRIRDSSLRDYLRVVSRRKWIIVSAVVLVPLAAVLFPLRQETEDVITGHSNEKQYVTSATADCGREGEGR